MTKNFLFIFAIFFCCKFCDAQVKLAYVFKDNMVLQRDKPICIFGQGVPQKKVEIIFSHKRITTFVKKDSSWQVIFPIQHANAIPQNIIIHCDSQQISLKNILIGDIWICSGQSNMEFAMQREMHFTQEIKDCNQPLIRLFNTSYAGKYVYGVSFTDSIKSQLNSTDFYKGKWDTCDSLSIRPMSAVAYYFAKSIVSQQKIPIGIINLSIGGAPIETFINKQTLLKDTLFSVKVKGDWLENNHLPLWIRQRGAENLHNSTGYSDELGLNHAYKPGFAYQTGIEPITKFPIKGFIFYQGESNSLELASVKEYKSLLHLMIKDYRYKWKQPNMPFYWVQLSSIDTTNYKSHYWPLFRDAQRALLAEVAHGGMAVCSDIGFKNDVHPTNKKTVGERLARWALFDTYQQKLVPSGPLPIQAIYQNNKVIIQYKYATGLQTSDKNTLIGFSVDGEEVDATIQNQTVVIKVNKKPAFVYYAWKPFTNANLVNQELLPASTFKIEVK
jgi:sialate O-acetylesterase